MSTTSTMDSSWSSQAGEAWNRIWFAPRDGASLAFLRIAVGLTWLYSLAALTPDLVRICGRGGLLPVTVVAQLQTPAQAAEGEFQYPSFAWSVLNRLGSPTELYVVHGIAIAAAVMLTVGFFARTAAVVSLVMVISYVNRMPLMAAPSDHLITLLLLALCWSPCGAYASIDAWRAARKRAASGKPLHDDADRASVTVNVATRLLQLHVALVYLMMALAKLNDGVSANEGEYHAWWMGEAAWWLGARTHAPLIDLTSLLSHSVVTNLWTTAIVAFEFFFPLLIWNQLSRPVVLIVSVPMWIGTAILSGLTPFCLLMLASGVVFVEPATIRNFVSRFTRTNP